MQSSLQTGKNKGDLHLLLATTKDHFLIVKRIGKNLAIIVVIGKNQPQRTKLQSESIKMERNNALRVAVKKNGGNGGSARELNCIRNGVHYCKKC